MYSEGWDCVSGFYDEVGVDEMKWGRVIGNTIIPVTLTLRCHASCGREKWCRNDEINTPRDCKSGCD